MARAPGRVSDAIANEWLTLLATRTTHLSVMTGDPYSVADPLTLEPAGGVYARAAVAWTRTGRLLGNSNSLSWTGIPAGTVLTHLAGWDAAFNGAVTFAMPITPLDYSSVTGGGLIIPVMELLVGLDL